MSRYQKYREKCLEIQKRYDDKNREKKHLYDKKRWEKRKKEHQALLDIKEYLEKELCYRPILISQEKIVEKIEDIVNKALGSGK